MNSVVMSPVLPEPRVEDGDTKSHDDFDGILSGKLA